MCWAVAISPATVATGPRRDDGATVVTTTAAATTATRAGPRADPAISRPESPRRDTSRRHDDEYGFLAPRLAVFAATARDDPRRRWLRDELVAAFWPLVVHIARRYRDRGEPLADLEQVGAIGLLGALERFDPGRGRDFLSYAVPTITGEIRRHFRDRAWAMRVPRPLKDLQAPVRDAVGDLSVTLGRAPRPSEIAAHLGVPVEQVIDVLGAGQVYAAHSLDALLLRTDDGSCLADRLGTIDGSFAIAECRQDLRRALAALSERDRTIVVLRFFGGLSQTQIGAQVGLSQMHISRLLSRTLTILRHGIDTP